MGLLRPGTVARLRGPILRRTYDIVVRKTFKAIAAEYGAVALIVYLTIFSLVLGGFWLAIRAGWSPKSVVGDVGTFTAAYLATKVTQPARIAATLAVTPFVARLVERVRGGVRTETVVERR